MINYKALIYIELDIIRIGIEAIFKKGFEECFLMVAHSSDEVEKFSQQFSFNLIILQLHQNYIHELNLIEKIKDNYNGTKVLLFNSNQYKDHYKKKFIHLTNGIINEETPSFELIQIIQVLLKSSDYFSNEVVLKKRVKKNHKKNLKIFKFKRLSTREFEVAMLLIKGYSNNKICNLLNLSSSTISTFKNRIFIKTNTKNVIELLQLYQTELRFY